MKDGFKEGYWYRLKEDYKGGELSDHNPLKDFKWRKCIKSTFSPKFSLPLRSWAVFFWREGVQEQCFNTFLDNMQEINPAGIIDDILNDILNDTANKKEQ